MNDKSGPVLNSILATKSWVGQPLVIQDALHRRR